MNVKRAISGTAVAIAIFASGLNVGGTQERYEEDEYRRFDGEIVHLDEITEAHSVATLGKPVPKRLWGLRERDILGHKVRVNRNWRWFDDRGTTILVSPKGHIVTS